MRAPGRRKSLGIVGGVGTLASADLYFKLVRSTLTDGGEEQFKVSIEQSPFDDGRAGADETFNPTARKLYIFNMISALEERKVDAVLLACFISHTFIEDLRSSINVPIINLMEALREFVRLEYPEVRKLGILTSNFVKTKALFENYFDSGSYELLYPSASVQTNCLMEAVYGPQGIKAGQIQGKSVDLIQQACQELESMGAELIIPGLTEIPMVIDALNNGLTIPVVDSNQVYADYAIAFRERAPDRPYKVGVIGGVGPAATVDFLEKIIQHTPANRDQEHIQMVIEHNPRIPDRTAHLVNGGPDPTIPLYAACKKLEANGADMIAIPCNTAHAFVERIQRHLEIPIVNMLFETTEYIKNHCQNVGVVGLLATNGTLQSRVYHDLFEQTKYELRVPDDEHQEMLMDVIYGDKGIKAGYTSGICLNNFHRVIEHITERGAEIVILGCTELPLLELPPGGSGKAATCRTYLDPTDILARKCASFADVPG